MTDAEYEAQKARIEALAARWIKPIGLGYWDIKTTFYRDAGDYARENDGGDANGGSLMACSSRWQYSHATIFVNLPEVAKQDDRELEQAFVHELMHCFLNEVRPLRNSDDAHVLDGEQMQHEEHAATALAKAFLWVRDMTKDGSL